MEVAMFCASISVAFPILPLSYLPFVSAVFYLYYLILLYFVSIILLLSTLYCNCA